MPFLSAFEIEDKREFNKVSLLKYIDDIELNKFEISVSNSIDDLKNKLNVEYEYLEKSHEETGSGSLHAVYEIESRLYSLYEMKIIYLFKDLEINLKKLISVAYNINFEKRNDWNMLMGILNTKGIEYSKIKCHQQVNNIRKVNNFLKHSTQPNSAELKNIKEFKGLKLIEYENLEQFYSHMKTFSSIWIQDLGDKIYNELYVYTNNRIKNLAESIALRLNKNDSKILSNYLDKITTTPE